MADIYYSCSLVWFLMYTIFKVHVFINYQIRINKLTIGLFGVNWKLAPLITHILLKRNRLYYQDKWLHCCAHLSLFVLPHLVRWTVPDPDPDPGLYWLSKKYHIGNFIFLNIQGEPTLCTDHVSKLWLCAKDFFGCIKTWKIAHKFHFFQTSTNKCMCALP